MASPIVTSGPSRPSSFAVVIGLAIALAGPAAVIWGRGLGWFGRDPAGQRILSSLALGGLGVAVLVWVVAVERRPLASIGLGRPSWAALGRGLAVGAAAVACYPMALQAGRALGLAGPQHASFAILFALPFWARLLLLVNAAFAEEILFRGYAITRLEALTGRRWFAASAALGVFVALHYTWGLASLVPIGLLGVLLTGLFLWRGDLWATIFAHLTVDAVPLLLATMVLGRS